MTLVKIVKLYRFWFAILVIVDLAVLVLSLFPGWDAWAAATIFAGITVLAAIPLTQGLSHKMALKRERLGELRKAIGEYGAACYSFLAAVDRQLVDGSVIEVFTKSPPPEYTTQEGKKKLADLSEKLRGNYINGFDRLLEARCRLEVLEVDEERRLEARALWERVIISRSKKTAETKLTSERRDMLEESHLLRSELDSWMSEQANRADLRTASVWREPLS